MAATNKCLAHSNKSRTGGKATNEAEPRAKCRRQSHEGYENESYRQSDLDDADLRDRVHRIHGHPSRAHAALAIHAMGAAIFDRRLRARAHSAGLSGAAAVRSLCPCQGGQSALYGEEDVRCRAAIVGNSVNAIIPIKRPSDDVVQTAPVKCRYTESGICANIAGFCLCTQANFALPSSHEATKKRRVEGWSASLALGSHARLGALKLPTQP